MFAKNDHEYREGQVTQEVAEVILFFYGRIFWFCSGCMKYAIGSESWMIIKIRGGCTVKRNSLKSWNRLKLEAVEWEWQNLYKRNKKKFSLHLNLLRQKCPSNNFKKVFWNLVSSHNSQNPQNLFPMTRSKCKFRQQNACKMQFQNSALIDTSTPENRLWEP